MKILIAGRSGTGKTTVCRTLQNLGLNAFDGDRVAGLADWRNPKTGRTIAVDSNKPIDKSVVQWLWNKSTLQELLQSHEDIVLCGSADSDVDCFSFFDQVFVLTLPPTIQRMRIVNRMEHDYGKLPATQDRIITEQHELVEAATKLDAIMVSAESTPDAIAHEIIRLSHAN